MDHSDILRYCERHAEAAAQSANLTDFADRIGGTFAPILHKHAHGWAELSFQQAKTRPDLYTHRPLLVPTAHAFADLFADAHYATHRTPGYYFLGGNYAGVPFGTHGGKRGVRVHKDGTATRVRMGASLYVSEVSVRPYVMDAIEDAGALIGPVGSFDVISRDDGILVIAHDTHRIGSQWLAVLDPGASLRPLLSEESQQFIANEAARDAEAFACIYRSVVDDRDHYNSNKGNPDFITHD